MDGILIVDKPQHFTSHDIVNLIRRRFNLKKVGHAGTLDPMATGVLVLLIGGCTKLSGSFMSDDKEYEATLVLGAVSDTGDAEGKIKETGNNVNFSRDEVESAFNKFSGPIEQIPPMYSAVKLKGIKLYQLARKGIEVERKPRKILIKKLEITKYLPPEISFRLTCSKGTYVRQLAADIGDVLGCGAYLSRLKRVRSGRFELNDSLSLDELERYTLQDLEKRLQNP